MYLKTYFYIFMLDFEQTFSIFYLFFCARRLHMIFDIHFFEMTETLVTQSMVTQTITLIITLNMIL